MTDGTSEPQEHEVSFETGEFDTLGREAQAQAQAHAPVALPEIRGPRLDQLLLGGVVVLVLIVVASSGALQVAATTREFKVSAQEQTTRLQNQAKETGRSLSKLVSLTAASSLRDNNYGALTELVQSTIANDPNVLRTQIVDAEGNVAADTDRDANEKKSGRTHDEKVVPGLYKGHPVYEYQTPVQPTAAGARGLVVLTYSLEQLQAELQRLDAAKRESIQHTTRRTILLAVGFIVASALLAAFGGRQVTRPLAELSAQALQLGSGNMTARVRRRFVGAGREVRTLGAVFNQMADQLSKSVDLAARKAGLEQEMSVARRVQETLLPPRTVFEFGTVRVAGLVNPADQCGGDWWLRAPLDDHRIAVSIGDVTGHGLSTALIATSALSAFAAVLRTHHSDHLDAELFMQAVNQTLFHVGHGEYQMSCAMMVFDTSKGLLQFSNGGHPFPCVYNRNTGQATSVTVRGPLLGRGTTLEAKSAGLQLKPGDVFVWYSDGLLEGRNPAGEAYGWKGLTASVQRNGHLPAEQLRDALVAEARAFSSSGKQEDDITVVVVEYTAR